MTINKTIRTDQRFSVSMVIIATIGIFAIGLTATTMTPITVQASPSGCPDPG
jgi:hypothetical protein